MKDELENKNGFEDEAEDKKSFLMWIKAHKKQLIIIGISIPTLIAIVLGWKNKSTLKNFFEELKEEVEKANLYSSQWFEKVSDTELGTVREKVCLAYCATGDNFKEACNLQNLLRRFDNEMSKRAWGNEIPHAPSIHREHGWYLPNDD